MKIRDFSKLHPNITEAISKINDLNKSKETYAEATEYLAKDQYVDAYERYDHVIEEDSDYNKAQEKMLEIKEDVKQELLDEADTLYSKKDYKEAIKVIDNVIKLDAEDGNLQAIKSTYEVAQAEIERIEKKEREEKKKIELAAKEMDKGEKITTKTKEIEFLGSEFTTKIMPPDTSGYYSYYPAGDDSIFYDLKFKVKNLDKYEIGLENIFTALTMDYDNGYTYSGNNFYVESAGRIEVVYSWDKLDPLTEIIYHTAIKVPRSIADDGKPITVTLKIDGKEKIITVR